MNEYIFVRIKVKDYRIIYRIWKFNNYTNFLDKLWEKFVFILCVYRIVEIILV